MEEEAGRCSLLLAGRWRIHFQLKRLDLEWKRWLNSSHTIKRR